ncbi:MAG: hypothetical protein IK127_08275 [Clostridia bacterium]|nr:hypothetical protein [Clostridia bacterium]
MKKRKIISRQIPLLILWLMASALLWSFILNIITDTDAAHKLVVYADTQVTNATELAVKLEENKPEAIRMVRVRPFTYAMMGADELAHADLLLVPEADFENYPDWFASVPDSLRTAGTLYEQDGEPLGMLVFDPETDSPDKQHWFALDAQRYYLAFGLHSLHVPGVEDAVDDAAVDCASRLLTLLNGTE